jgi:carbamoyltransferase
VIVLGINGINDIFHDASATLIVDNQIIASVEEERFNRKKHSKGVPVHAINFCLEKAGFTFADIDHIGYYLDPSVLKKSFVDNIVSQYRCSPDGLQHYVNVAENIKHVKDTLAQHFSFSPKTQFHYLNHHLAHASSAYYISGFDESAVLTVDGSGDRETSTLYYGQGAHLIKICDFLVYPESLGFIYTVFAYHLGFGWIEGPGKLMGLAGYGTPDLRVFEDIIVLQNNPDHPIHINLSFFNYHIGGNGFTEKGIQRFGLPRQSGEALNQTHYDLAASMQKTLENAILHLVSFIPQCVPQTKNLCFAGGVALNVCTNRRIFDTGLFDHVFVPPPAYDGGTSLGCALYLNTLYTNCAQYTFNVYCGPNISEDYNIEAALIKFKNHLQWEKLSEEELCETAAQSIQENKIIGWAQGKMECGPRALGNRSILTNAMNPRAKNDLNTRVKKRESFRPYAPSVLHEESEKWFDLAYSPYMLLEARVHPEKQKIVPGIVHIDGTSRPQTVSKTDNPRYYQLINKFYERTGVPIVLNTSFNRHGEPIINTPEEAIDVLLTTDMDALFIRDYHIQKRRRPPVWRKITSRIPFLKQDSISERPTDKQSNWKTPFEVLRRKWHEVPAGDQRHTTKELSKLTDQEFLEQWFRFRDEATTGAAFAIRGWYHMLYKDLLRQKKVMDVGSGLGIDGITFAQHGANVTFVDIVESNLVVLQRLCRLLGVTNVNFCYLETLTSLTMLPTDYDVIWCQGSLINAPFEVIHPEAQELLKHLLVGGRWIELAYPKERWERDGRLPFERWGERTDGGAPWVEWYDLNKVMAILSPVKFDVVLYFNFHNDEFNWFDLVRRQ